MKSVVRVVPKAGSEGHVATNELESDHSLWRGEKKLTVCQRITVGEGLCVGDSKACQQQSCGGKSCGMHSVAFLAFVVLRRSFKE